LLVIADVRAAPQPALGLGLPAAIAMSLVSAITFVMQRKA
jgi:hypothetical protein